MKQPYLISLICCLLFPFFASAQSDAFQGTWQMEYVPGPGAPTITINLQIAAPEKNLLYPAEMKLQCDSFTATYHLLLVKRNIRQLSVGRNKIPASEIPFSIGNWTIYLNGILDLSRDLRGASFLSSERIFTKNYGVTMTEPVGLAGSEKTAAIRVRDFLKDADIKLKKLNADPWISGYIDTILTPHLTADYFGIVDTINVNDRKGSINFSGNKKNSGIVSVILNGTTIVDQNDLTVRRPTEDIKLDTGQNILVFFAENYGKSISNTGNLFVVIGDRKFSLDFSNKKDIAATFIVAKIYYAPEKDTNSNFQNSILNELSEADLQRDIKQYHYPDPTGRNLLKNDTAKILSQQTLLRTAKSVGSIKTSSRQIILAIWDDAVEDGDTISLSINGHWIVQSFPVKKQPQFISVIIDPGPNKIVFIANNLGSIPPNTSVLEIIDGRQRKSFMLETTLDENNLINILYDPKPD